MQLASSGGRQLTHVCSGRDEKLALENGRTVTRKELSAAAREAAKALELRNGPPDRSCPSSLPAGASRNGSGCWCGRPTIIS